MVAVGFNPRQQMSIIHVAERRMISFGITRGILVPDGTIDKGAMPEFFQYRIAHAKPGKAIPRQIASVGWSNRIAFPEMNDAHAIPKSNTRSFYNRSFSHPAVPWFSNNHE